MLRTEHFGYLTHCVSDAVARDPYNPDGHIALGLVYQNSLEPGLSRCGMLTDFGQSEFEYKQAITLSPNRRNDEAQRLLNALPALKKAAEAQRKGWKSCRTRTRRSFLEEITKKLLLNRWTPSTSTHFYLTRIRVEHNTQFGDLRAVVLVPSSNAEYDEAAFKALQSILDDFRLFALEHYEFQFASQNGQRWIEWMGPGSVGKLGLLAFEHEPFERATARAREFSLRWTETRVKNYCTVETQLPNLLQHKYPPVGGHKFIGEDFPFQLPEDLMPAYWRAGSYCNSPVRFAALAAGGKWILEFANVDCRKYTDDDFAMHRISDAVFFSMRRYELAHIDDLDEHWKVRSRSMKPHESLTRDAGGKLIAFKSQLSDGSELTVDLDSSGNVATIRVDGKVDVAWNKAYRESALSLELADKALQDFFSK
ncbi:MAG: hypothetical protein DKT66_12625 [Candidatus Melainabacteria bacterium]|nr:MAG: hypothetical protein DKT66_12625 [Candidatus Melainabacteria bacterium]